MYKDCCWQILGGINLLLILLTGCCTCIFITIAELCLVYLIGARYTLSSLSDRIVAVFMKMNAYILQHK